MSTAETEYEDPESGPLPVVYSPPNANVTLFGTDDPRTVIAKAREAAGPLAQAIGDAGYVVTIQRRSHVKVEGWTMLGSMLGVFPIVVWTRRLTDPEGWEARVEARTRFGELVGSAEAQCTRDEAMWSHHPVGRNGRELDPRDDYALRSMAQTRAIRAALRAPLGFVMGLAGFEPDGATDDSYERRSTGGRPSGGEAAGRERRGGASPEQTPRRPTKAQLNEELGTVFEELAQDRKPDEIVDKDEVTVEVDDWRDYARIWAEREFGITDSTKLSAPQLQALIDHLAEKRIKF